MELFGEFWGVYTLLMFVIFVGIWVWAWSSKRRKAFKDAANLPFADEVPEKKQGLPNQEENQS